MIKNILTGVMVIFVTAIVAIFATSVSVTEAGPLLDEPTPTPTAVVAYWTDTVGTWGFNSADGGEQCLEDQESTSSPSWYQDTTELYGSCMDLTAPEGNVPAGIIVTLNSITYTDGQIRLRHGTNTNWVKRFNEMELSETICVGTSGACSSVDMSVDPDSDWEGYNTTPEGVAYVGSLYVAEVLGYGSVNYSIQPIWYGDWACDPVDPENREEISTGLLHGDDEEGEWFHLTPGQQYLLIIAEGPWNDGTDDRYDVAVRFKTSHAMDPPGGEWGEWQVISALEGGDDICDDSFLDENGSAFMFTAVQDEQSKIQFRVNDEDGEFDDNSGDVVYYWMGEEGKSGQGCEDQWTVGNKVAGGSINSAEMADFDLAQLYSGGQYSGRVAGGQSYLYKVTGLYLDDGVPEDDTWVIAGLGGTQWTDPNNAFLSSNDQCEDDSEDSIKAYYGVTKDDWESTYDFLRGSEPWTGFPTETDGDRTGSITAEWYEATWTAPASDCGTKYSIGTFIESPVIFANDEDGNEYPNHTNGLVVDQVYYLESQGTPYLLNGTGSYDFEVGVDLDIVGAVIWQDPEEFFDCITPLDQNRNGYYFTATEESFYIRAEYTLSGHDANSGTLKFNLYGAIPNEVPDGEDCGDYYDLDVLRWRGEVDADSTSGYPIDHSVFDPGSRYAIKITGAYTDPVGSGKTAEIRRSVQGAGSVDWDDMSDWIPALCYEQDDGFDVVYFEASVGADYEIRATSPIGNSGTMEFEVWKLDQIKTTTTGCEYNYAGVDAWYVVKQDDIVYANSKGVELDDNDNVTAITGYVMANEFSDDTLNYKIETGYIDTTMPPQWDLQVSTDGGYTWMFLQDWVDCWVDLGTPEGRGYFTTPVDDSGPFILRVYDVGGVYLNNVGGVKFSMWVDSASDNPGDIWSNPDVYAESWGIGCTAVCWKPGILQVGEWVEYARCRLTRWLAWCPWHARAMDEMRDAFAEVEPFRTIFEVVELGVLVRQEVDSYSWNNDGGGGEGVAEMTAPPNYIFMPGDAGGAGIDQSPLTGPDTIWGEGEIEFDTNSYSFRTECDTELSQALGTRIAPALCFGFNVLDQLGLRLWFQMFWDGFMFIALVMYIKRAWVDPLQ